MNDFDNSANLEQIKLIGDRSHQRLVFLRKLYALLALHSFLITIVLVLAIRYPSYGTWLSDHHGVVIAAGIQLGIVVLLAYFFRGFFRKTPWNFLVYIYVSLNAFILASWLSDGHIWPVVTSSLTVLSLALFAYALTTNGDLTFLGGTIYIIGAALFNYTASLIVTNISFFNLMAMTAILIILGFYLIYDTRFLLIGQSSSSTLEDPFVGVVVLYVDIPLIGVRLIEAIAKIFRKNRY